jgi:antitoxin component of RelBE/YafQ-DinJ toxin-antitoxin module
MFAKNKIRVMDTKLTLNVDSDLIQSAKSYAKEKGRSLSDLFEMYLRSLINKNEIMEEELTPKVRSLLGLFKMPEDFNYKKELSDQLSRKYL